MAMDVLSWLRLKDEIWLNYAGNQDVFAVPKELRDKATEALQRLTEDELKDIRARARSLLNLDPDENPKGVRKHVAPQSNEGNPVLPAPTPE